MCSFYFSTIFILASSGPGIMRLHEVEGFCFSVSGNYLNIGVSLAFDCNTTTAITVTLIQFLLKPKNFHTLNRLFFLLMKWKMYISIQNSSTSNPQNPPDFNELIYVQNSSISPDPGSSVGGAGRTHLPW